MRLSARFSVSLVVSLVLVGFLPSPSSAQQPEVTIRPGKFETAQERNADRAFRMTEGLQGPAHAERLARGLFARAGKQEQLVLKDDGDGHLLHVGQEDPSVHFRIDKVTGNFSFNRGMSDLHTPTGTPNLPGRDRAIELAKRHLLELGELPDEAELVVRHVGGMRMTEQDDTGRTHTVDKLVTVHFGRQIDGVDVAGPGSKISVDLGSNGDLVGLVKRWTTVREERIPAAQLRSSAEVERSIRGQIQREWATATRAIAEAAELGYFDDGRGNIEPAYFYTSELEHGGTDDQGRPAQVKSSWLGVVPALKNPRATFEQEGRPTNQPKADDSPRSMN
jgi:hypothetical protein